MREVGSSSLNMAYKEVCLFWLRQVDGGPGRAALVLAQRVLAIAT